jgi:hypothetical protein
MGGITIAGMTIKHVRQLKQMKYGKLSKTY